MFTGLLSISANGAHKWSTQKEPGMFVEGTIYQGFPSGQPIWLWRFFAVYQKLDGVLW